MKEEERARITVTFMGLYGVSAALPVYFYNDIATEAPETYPLRDFLDIFNHRIYAFFYRAWKKYQPALFRDDAKANQHQHIFESVAGVGTPGVVRPEAVPAPRLRAFAGFLAHAVRSAQGLTQMASDLLDLPVRIVENIERWVPIRDRPRMGGLGSQTAQLGINTVVGQRVRDISGKFRLVVGPLNLAQYVSLLPGGDQAGVLDYVVRLYTTDFLDYDVELQLNTADVPPVKLGGAQRMGMDMWIGRPAGDLISVVVDYT
jgi:type VI secretion system protein ImpH